MRRHKHSNYELCSSRQQAVRLQVNLTTASNFTGRRRACSREKRRF
ncbi:hypothetical protein I6F65_12775 [Pseudoalteromonas sp. SWXJZ94C]|nr:hypothetical protein [Pseudoalteromonas sp. SWXJZ94C]MBH0057839.1 hypothetical protein [Pseudoalteromonas sp. SWXJZ94C]